MTIEGLSPAFGQNLRRLRGEYYLSQKALAKLIGVSVYSLRGWEDGTIAPAVSQYTLQRLCAVFGTTAEELTRPH